MYVQNQVGSILGNAYGNAAQMTANAGAIRGQGMANFGQQMGGALQQLGGIARDNKQQAARAKQVEKMLRTDEDFARSMGVDPAQLDAMSRKDFMAVADSVPLKLQAGSLAIRQEQLREVQEYQDTTRALTGRVDEALQLSRNPGPLKPELRAEAERLARSPLGAMRQTGLPITPELVQSVMMAERQAGPGGFATMEEAERVLGGRTGQIMQSNDGSFKVQAQVNRPEAEEENDPYRGLSSYARHIYRMRDAGNYSKEQAEDLVRQHDERTARGPEDLYSSYSRNRGQGEADPRVTAQEATDRLQTMLTEYKPRGRLNPMRLVGTGRKDVLKAWQESNAARAAAGLAPLPMPELDGEEEQPAAATGRAAPAAVPSADDIIANFEF